MKESKTMKCKHGKEGKPRYYPYIACSKKCRDENRKSLAKAIDEGIKIAYGSWDNYRKFNEWMIKMNQEAIKTLKEALNKPEIREKHLKVLKSRDKSGMNNPNYRHGRYCS